MLSSQTILTVFEVWSWSHWKAVVTSEKCFSSIFFPSHSPLSHWHSCLSYSCSAKSFCHVSMETPLMPCITSSAFTHDYSARQNAKGCWGGWTVPLPIPRGLNEALGCRVLVESIKFSEAQKMPDKTLVSSFQVASTLKITTSKNRGEKNSSLPGVPNLCFLFFLKQQECQYSFSFEDENLQIGP